MIGGIVPQNYSRCAYTTLSTWVIIKIASKSSSHKLGFSHKLPLNSQFWKHNWPSDNMKATDRKEREMVQFPERKYNGGRVGNYFPNWPIHPLEILMDFWMRFLDLYVTGSASLHSPFLHTPLNSHFVNLLGTYNNGINSFYDSQIRTCLYKSYFIRYW